LIKSIESDDLAAIVDPGRGGERGTGEWNIERGIHARVIQKARKCPAAAISVVPHDLAIIVDTGSLSQVGPRNIERSIGTRIIQKAMDSTTMPKNPEICP